VVVLELVVEAVPVVVTVPLVVVPSLPVVVTVPLVTALPLVTVPSEPDVTVPSVPEVTFAVDAPPTPEDDVPALVAPLVSELAASPPPHAQARKAKGVNAAHALNLMKHPFPQRPIPIMYRSRAGQATWLTVRNIRSGSDAGSARGAATPAVARRQERAQARDESRELSRHECPIALGGPPRRDSC
jgi:hypothetical protein